jgi:hypothetical protein
MYRAHRRFIGHPWAFLYPLYFVKLHYRPSLVISYYLHKIVHNTFENLKTLSVSHPDRRLLTTLDDIKQIFIGDMLLLIS